MYIDRSELLQYFLYFKQDSASAFLRDFNPDDIRCVNLFATSVDLWEISQPIRDTVVKNLLTNVIVPVRFSYTITRNPPNQDNSGDIAAVVTGEHTVNILEKDKSIREALINILNGTTESRTAMYDLENYIKKSNHYFLFRNFTIVDLMPRFLHVKPKAKPEEIDAFKTSNKCLEILFII